MKIKFRQKLKPEYSKNHNDPFHYWGYVDHGFTSPVGINHVVEGSTDEQFTNFKDVDGVEIYVGDIVFITEEDGSTKYESIVSKPSFFSYSYSSQPLDTLINSVGMKMKVVGNIYENAELLEEAVEVKATKAVFTLEPDEKTLEYFLSTAIEQGMSYWAEGKDCERTDDGDYISIMVRDAEDDEQEWKLLDLDVVRKGFQIYFDKWQDHANYSKIFWFVKSQSEEGDYDADDADMIVQLGLFGDIVYG